MLGNKKNTWSIPQVTQLQAELRTYLGWVFGVKELALRTERGKKTYMMSEIKGMLHWGQNGACPPTQQIGNGVFCVVVLL